MNDLTEKWKNKELPHGAFYVKVFTGAILVDFFDATILKFVICEDDIEEVIDYVPCYTNLQAIKERADALSDRVNCQKNRIACLEYDLNRCNRLLKQWEEINRHMMQCHGYINHSDFHPTIRETLELTKEMENE